MTDSPSILVPIRVLEGESVPDGVPELLAHTNVVLLGYHVIPEQTAPGQARLQFEERAVDRLDEFERLFADAGATTQRTLVFTHDREQTIDRTVADNGCLAVLVPNAVRSVESVLVPVGDAVGIDRLTRVVAGVFADHDCSVTLYHVAQAVESDQDVETLLDGMVERLDEAGLAESRIERRIERDQDALDAITEEAEAFDVVVMGETDPSVGTFLFGMPAEQVAERFLGPVLVVQNRPESS